VNRRYLFKIYRKIKCISSYFSFSLRYRGRIIYTDKIGRFYSQNGQDVIISSFLFPVLTNNPSSTIVDIGCGDPDIYSMSLFFEQYFNSDILSVDAVDYSQEFKKRKKVNFVNALIRNGKDFFCNYETGMHDRYFSVSGAHLKDNENAVLMDSVTLTDLLLENKISNIDLLSIVIPGNEISILNSIDFLKFNVKSIYIQNNDKACYGSNKIRKYMEKEGFYLLARLHPLGDFFIHQSLVHDKVCLH